MRKPRLICATVSALAVALPMSLAAGAMPAVAQTLKATQIEVVEPFVRATPGGARVGAGYLKIRNTGEQPDRLISVESTAAESVMIHSMVQDGGVAKMRHVDNGLILPAKSTTELAPGGLHLMFMGPRAPFDPGNVVKATLQFEKAGKLDVTFEVKPIGTR